MRRLQKEQERILRKQAKDQEKYEVAERKRLRSMPFSVNNVRSDMR